MTFVRDIWAGAGIEVKVVCFVLRNIDLLRPFQLGVLLFHSLIFAGPLPAAYSGRNIAAKGHAAVCCLHSCGMQIVSDRH